MIACVSATAHAIPPFIMFYAKDLNYEWTKEQVSETRYDLSSTDWVNTELFKGCMVEPTFPKADEGLPS